MKYRPSIYLAVWKMLHRSEPHALQRGHNQIVMRFIVDNRGRIPAGRNEPHERRTFRRSLPVINGKRIVRPKTDNKQLAGEHRDRVRRAAKRSVGKWLYGYGLDYAAALRVNDRNSVAVGVAHKKISAVKSHCRGL